MAFDWMPAAIIAGLLLVASVIMQLLVLQRLQVLLKAAQDAGLQELLLKLKNMEAALQQGFADSRKELREVSAENRRELQEAFKNLQDALLNRIVESQRTQNVQMDTFKNGLANMSERLINNASEFRESVSRSFQATGESLNRKQDDFRDKTAETLKQFQEGIKADAKENRQELTLGLNSFEAKFAEGIKDFNEQLRLKFSDLNRQQQEANQLAKTGISEIREAIEKQLLAIREDNSRQLNEMRQTVDEKLHNTLEQRLGESFKLVSDRLDQVHKGLGEMQNLAVGVGDLKKVLSNVKTRGILGEYQLGNILEQILSPEQYGVNVATKKGSQANVEYAVKLPGKADDKTVWLPIDSKFPLESYQLLLGALDEGNPAAIDAAQKQLLKAIESFAKDIAGKYLDPPHTTDFAIMFLPVESLYAEVLRSPELFEKLQRTYRVTITGPTTLSALLNSLHMGFRTLAVQQRSSEVWKVLAEVKTEFGKYSELLDTVYKQLTTASNSLERLKTTRTAVMERKLRGVEVLGIESDLEPIGLPEPD
ncbi:DNA recombination protein RmuC [Methylomicrobium sp. Wu6]|uniref:DNA recombination protein RmuC n=1 Tax=Methylomicrobium sp. Wu6 TaxID=3107928 RepID=UPI002DD67145|nr:DNA recombination protein RmuC [Methylomicrobium sp. Wu6]MEC4750465.1 DNA recombination protein RmuC [Methylomicrobium sp. Wu6]